MIRKQDVNDRKKSIGFQHSKYGSSLLCLVCFIVFQQVAQIIPINLCKGQFNVTDLGYGIRT